jgi:hypothetical protein
MPGSPVARSPAAEDTKSYLDGATGKTMAVDEVFFFRFHDELISEMWAIEDTWTRKRQLWAEIGLSPFRAQSG